MALSSLPGNEDFSFILPPALKKIIIKKKTKTTHELIFFDIAVQEAHRDERLTSKGQPAENWTRASKILPVLFDLVFPALPLLIFFSLLTFRHTKAGLAKLSLCVPHTPLSPFHVQNHSISPPPFPIIYILTGRDGRTHSCGGIIERSASQRQTQAGKRTKKKRKIVNLYTFSGNQRWDDNY